MMPGDGRVVHDQHIGNQRRQVDAFLERDLPGVVLLGADNVADVLQFFPQEIQLLEHGLFFRGEVGGEFRQVLG